MHTRGCRTRIFQCEYSSIPESSDLITWIPGQVRKRRIFFLVVYVCLNAIRNLIVVSKPLVTPISMVSLFSMHIMCMNLSNMLKDCTFMHL